jgi:hypothetical protein
MNYYEKYLEFKLKYLNLKYKKQQGGAMVPIETTSKEMTPEEMSLELIEQCKIGDIRAVERLISNSIEFLNKDKDTLESQVYAVYLGDTNIDLINLIKLNYKNSLGESALFHACNSNKIQIARLLLENGANINIKNNDGITPLMQACKNGNTEMVNLLIQSSNLDDTDNNGNTALFYACDRNNYEIVSLLIKKANINIKNNKGLTPLMHASYKNKRESLSAFIFNYHGDEITDVDLQYIKTIYTRRK